MKMKIKNITTAEKIQLMSAYGKIATEENKPMEIKIAKARIDQVEENLKHLNVRCTGFYAVLTGFKVNVTFGNGHCEFSMLVNPLGDLVSISNINGCLTATMMREIIKEFDKPVMF